MPRDNRVRAGERPPSLRRLVPPERLFESFFLPHSFALPSLFLACQAVFQKRNMVPDLRTPSVRFFQHRKKRCGYGTWSEWLGWKLWMPSSRSNSAVPGSAESGRTKGMSPISFRCLGLSRPPTGVEGKLQAQPFGRAPLPTVVAKRLTTADR